MILDTDPQLVAERNRKLADLGPRPAWWRWLARRRWDARKRAVLAMDVSRQAMLLRSIYGTAQMQTMAAAPNPFLAISRSRAATQRFVQVVVTPEQMAKVENDPELMQRLERENEAGVASLHRIIRSKP